MFSTILRSENNKYYKITGVDKWHVAGYFGERVNAASAEDWDLADYNPDNLCAIPFGNGTTDNVWHGVSTAKTFHQVAPMCSVAQLPCSAIHSGSNYDSRFINESIPYIKENNIHLLFKSTSASHHRDLDTALEEVSGFFTLFCSAGNKDDTSYNGWGDSPYVISVPAYQISADGRFRIEGYSSESLYNDFAGPSWVAIPPNGHTQGGTSFSNPWVCGMAALVQDFFIDKTGKPLTNAKLQQFFKDNVVDIGDEGFDVKTGFGMAYLPPPETIDINKYSEVEQMKTPIDFKDFEDIPQWLINEGSLQECLNYNLIKGDSENNFNPNENVTRAEMSAIIGRFILLLKDRGVM